MKIIYELGEARKHLDAIGVELKVRRTKRRAKLKSEWSYISDEHYNRSLDEINEIEEQIKTVNKACDVLDKLLTTE